MKLTGSNLTFSALLGKSRVDVAVIEQFKSGDLGIKLPSKISTRSADDLTYHQAQTHHQDDNHLNYAIL